MATAFALSSVIGFERELQQKCAAAAVGLTAGAGLWVLAAAATAIHLRGTVERTDGVRLLGHASQPSTVSPGSVLQVSLPPWPRTRSFPSPSTEFSVSLPSRPLNWSASFPPTAESFP